MHCLPFALYFGLNGCPFLFLVFSLYIVRLFTLCACTLHIVRLFCLTNCVGSLLCIVFIFYCNPTLRRLHQELAVLSNK